MSAALYDITIEKRACFSLALAFTNSTGGIYNLSGVTLTGQIRRDFDDALQAVFTTQILSTGSGTAIISLDSATTANLDIAASSWDLFADKSGQCSDKLRYGSVSIINNKTK